MAKISYCLVFTLVLLPLYSVLCQEDAWQSVLNQATQSAGISQDTLDMAKQAMGDGSAQKATKDALGDADGSLVDWVQEFDDVPGGSSPSPTETQVDLPDDEEEDNLVETPKNSPTEAPGLAPKKAPRKTPVDAPELSPKISAKRKAPTNAPSAAPQAHSPHAATPQP